MEIQTCCSVVSNKAALLLGPLFPHLTGAAHIFSARPLKAQLGHYHYYNTLPTITDFWLVNSVDEINDILSLLTIVFGDTQPPGWNTMLWLVDSANDSPRWCFIQIFTRAKIGMGVMLSWQNRKYTTIFQSARGNQGMILSNSGGEV